MIDLYHYLHSHWELRLLGIALCIGVLYILYASSRTHD